tara:strand:+ start:43 stop:2529 length:2487 start_codon:yes stop_codon:yes gene_type:complete
MSAKTLSDNGYTLFNVDDTKKPVYSGFGIVDWINMPHNELKKRIDFNKEMFGMRLGKQGNQKYILSLDFDCCKKVNGEYIKCQETIDLLRRYRRDVDNGDKDGMFESSTEGNENVLIDYTDTIILKELILKETKNKIVRSDVGLELLIGGNQVIPPSMTKCKMTGKFNKRRSFMTDVPFKVVQDDDPICEFIIDYIKSANQINTNTKKRKYQKIEPIDETEEVAEETKTEEKETELLDMISIDCWDDFNIWKKLLWAMKNEGYMKSMGRKYSMLSASFDEEAFNRTWDKSPSSITLTQGTINYYAKQSNESKYCEYINKSIFNNKKKLDFVENRTDKGFADVIISLLSDDLVYTESNELYVCYKSFWRKDDGMVMNLAQKRVIKLCDDYMVELSIQRNQVLEDEGKVKEYSDKMKEVLKTISAISTSSKLKSILEQVKISLKDRQKNIEFDSYTPDVFCFNNIAFSLDSGEEYQVKKHDYITMRSGYDYEPPTDDEVKTVSDIFDSVFPDDEMKKTYISILRTGLSGHRQEKLFMANGGGRNGKGLINELMMDTVGSYGHKLNISVLTEKIKSGANPEVNNLHHKRFVVSSEPNDNESILAGNIKRLTGDDVIDARGLYCSNGKTTLDLTLVLELNKMINLQGRVDDAIVERLVGVRFPCFFTNDQEELENNPNAKKGNLFYKKHEFRIRFKHALFKFLLDSPNGLYICSKAKNDTREYLLDNDDMYNWFIDNYEKTDDKTSFVKLKGIYDMWKTSDLYNNMNKASKRKANMKNFKQNYIIDNNELKKYYVEDSTKTVDGKKVALKICLVGWRLKTECMIDTSDKFEG